MIIFALPGQSMGFCVFTEPILHATGMSRTAFSVVYMIATILGGCGVLASGKLIDRLGTKKSLIVALPLWALTLFALGSYSLVHKILQNFLSHEKFCIVFFIVCMAMLRFLGQNVLPLLGRMQIVRTFSGATGIAVAVCGLFISSSRGVIPQIVKFLSKDGGWEHAFRVLSLFGLVMLPMVIFFFRDRSGAEPVKCRQKEGKKCVQIAFESRRKLLKTPVFWCMASALCLNEFIGSGTAIHIVDIFRERGVSENIALSTYIPLSISTVIAGFCFGKFVDLGRIKLTVLFMLLAQLLGLVGLDFAPNWACITLYALSTGASWGGHRVLLTVAWSKIFGQEHSGEILGFVYCLLTVVGAISVPLMSIFKHQFGSYFFLIHILQIFAILCAIMCAKKFPS
ncbi:MAG: MFS transporter [Puniceicoccales bacterium]|nr:MFS transporter [Puniceicoccales bacterium]